MGTARRLQPYVSSKPSSGLARSRLDGQVPVAGVLELPRLEPQVEFLLADCGTADPRLLEQARAALDDAANEGISAVRCEIASRQLSAAARFYRPVKTGFRFSRKAATPSRKSARAALSANISASS